MVKIEQWIGSQITFLVSDPWDFCTQHGGGPFSGIIEETATEVLLIKADTSFLYQGLIFDHLVARPRHSGTTLTDLSINGALAVNMIPVSLSVRLQPQVAKQYGYVPGSPFHMAASWRGWSLISELRMTSEQIVAPVKPT